MDNCVIYDKARFCMDFVQIYSAFNYFRCKCIIERN